MSGPRRRAPGSAAACLAILGGLALPAGGEAQPAGPAGRACTLVLEPATDSTQSVRVQVEPGRYVTYVGNGIRGICGDARMTADSAVNYGGEQRVRMIGNVDYRDSIRTLTADTLTYFQREDRVVALGDVVVERRASGSRLRGPRVEFLRVGSPEDRRTVATGRSRLLVYPDSAARDTAARDSAAPVEVDADRIVMLGEREVRTWGDVRIRRPRVDARADSAFFQLEAGTGRLMGGPRVEGESFTLTGDTILTGFAGGELREVESVRRARATGEDFDLYAERIRARMADDELERLWAHGEGRSVAVSPPYRLAADSLDTAFAAGEMDTLYAVGAARAVELGGEPEEDPRRPITLAAGERSWITGDTLIFSFARPPAADSAAGARPGPAPGEVATDTGGAAGDTLPAAADAGGNEAPPARAEETRIERVRAVGSARAYHVLEPGEAGDRPARDYQLARVIEIFFREGEVDRVVGEQAVGIHLDPLGDRAAEPPGEAGATPPADTSRALPADTAGEPPPGPAGGRR